MAKKKEDKRIDGCVFPLSPCGYRRSAGICARLDRKADVCEPKMFQMCAPMIPIRTTDGKRLNRKQLKDLIETIASQKTQVG